MLKYSIDMLKESRIDMLIEIYAYRHRDATSLRYDELSEGELAVALIMFDYLFKKCKEDKKCPDFGKGWRKVLNNLSIAKCLQMKAYHNWIAKNQPMQDNPEKRDEDYIYACQELDTWMVESCSQEEKEGLKDKIREFFIGKKDELVLIKAYWQSMANPFNSVEANFYDACTYVDKFYGFLDTRIISIDGLSEWLKNYASMMSVLEFLFLSCNLKTINKNEEL